MDVTGDFYLVESALPYRTAHQVVSDTRPLLPLPPALPAALFPFGHI